MKFILPKNDSELCRAFNLISTTKPLSKPVFEISQLISITNLTNETISEVLKKYQLKNIIALKEELLDLLLIYINVILDDHIIAENERFNIEILKKYFKIKEGDFYTYRYSEVENILTRQFTRIYSDKIVDKKEALHSVGLQELFDLSYDQFENFKKIEIIKALKQGADISNLDTATLPNSKFKQNKKD